MWCPQARTRPCAHYLAAAGMEPRVMSKKDVIQRGKFLNFVGGEREG